jgi:hypothetical protein
MDEAEAEEHILKILRKHGQLTTKELETLTKSSGKQCPDGTLQFLNKLRFTGKIKGEVSMEKRGWVWWVGD